MPPFVHKIHKVHGCDIMRKFVKPIGYFSEEAQKSNNKNFVKLELHIAECVADVKLMKILCIIV